MNFFLILAVCGVVVLCGVFIWLNFRRVRRERTFPASTRAERRAAARKVGAHTLIWFRRRIQERKYANRHLRRRLAKAKIRYSRRLGTRNPKKLNCRIRKVRRWIREIQEKQHATAQTQEEKKSA